MENFAGLEMIRFCTLPSLHQTTHTPIMKKLLTLLLFACFTSVSFAQNGLEDVIIERYYVSEANDTLANGVGGILPVGSVTYRIYLDMLPGYKFQVAYGVANHEMRIETSTLFFNNEDRGSTTPNFTAINAAKNTVMLDSWLSCGAACVGRMGILKAEDDGVNNIVNTFVPQVLQNTDPIVGIPLTIQDGLILATPEPFTELGITNEIAVFDNQNDGTNGPVFSTFNGSWSALNGASGPDSLTNKVLIAQITTDGNFCFKLNVQLRTPTPGIVENYVWSNPTGSEILFPALQYCANVGNPEIESETPAPAFSVYPNPSADIFSMWVFGSRVQGDYNYRVYALDGRTVVNRRLGVLNSDVMEKIDLGSLESGVYFVELEFEGKTTTRKIVKR